MREGGGHRGRHFVTAGRKGFETAGRPVDIKAHAAPRGRGAASGDPVPARVWSGPMRDREKTKTELTAELRELRRRLTEAEAASQTTELELLRSFAAALPDLAFVFDSDGRTLDVITRSHELLFATPDAVVGRSLGDILPPSVAEPAIDLLRLALDTGEPQELEYELDVPAGPRWFEARLARMDSPRGARVACVVRDITDRRSIDEALRRSEARLHAVIESLPFEFYALDRDGAYVMQNSISRHVRGDVVGQRPEEVAPTEELRRVWASNHRRAFAGESVTSERVLPIDGERRHVLHVVAPIRRGRDIDGLVGLTMDLTDQRTLTDQMHKTQKLESLGLLASGIAHDFNNLLMAVVGHISLARMQQKAGANTEPLLEEAERACLRAQALTQQLMTFARGGEPVPEVVHLPELLRESARFATAGSRCRCELDVPSDLWPALVDLGQIHQVINNLILNSVQAMPQGGIIGVAAENVNAGPELGVEAGRYVRFLVADAGVGISADDLARVFDPYFTTSPENHGLGLAVAHSIVTRHGGTITIDSHEGEGSVAVVLLPAAEPGAARVEVVAEPAARGSGRVLVMDDEAALRSVTTTMLESLGYSAEAAASCLEAVALFEKARAERRPFRAAVLDLTVPGGPGGLECMARLRAIDPGIRAVVSSGYSSDPVLANYDQHGFAGVLPKPFSREQLGAVLRDVLGTPSS